MHYDMIAICNRNSHTLNTATRCQMTQHARWRICASSAVSKLLPTLGGSKAPTILTEVSNRDRLGCELSDVLCHGLDDSWGCTAAPPTDWVRRRGGTWGEEDVVDAAAKACTDWRVWRAALAAGGSLVMLNNYAQLWFSFYNHKSGPNQRDNNGKPRDDDFSMQKKLCYWRRQRELNCN